MYGTVKSARPEEVLHSGPCSRLLCRTMERGRNRARYLERFNGEVIRKLRLERGLSQDQLADLIGTKKANVSRWELSRTPVEIGYSLFLALSRALFIPPEKLAERLSAPPATSESPARHSPSKDSTRR